MSIYLALFHALRLGNRVHIHIFVKFFSLEYHFAFFLFYLFVFCLFNVLFFGGGDFCFVLFFLLSFVFCFFLFFCLCRLIFVSFFVCLLFFVFLSFFILSWFGFLFCICFFLGGVEESQLHDIKYSYQIQIMCRKLNVWFSVFLSRTNNYIVSSKYFYIIRVICLRTVIWFQVTNNNNNP